MGRLFIGNEIEETLTKEEFNYYYLKYKSGDKESYNYILNHNIGLVIDKALSFKRTYSFIEETELVSIGLQSLTKALNNYDISKGTAFSTYATTYINNAMIKEIYKQQKQEYIDSLDREIINPYERTPMRLGDTIEDYNQNAVETYEKEQLKIRIREIVNTLPEGNSKEFIKLYFGFYGETTSQPQIAAIFGYTKANVSKMILKTLQKISIILKQEGWIDITYEEAKTRKRNNS